jgi:hypothetical protein
MFGGFTNMSNPTRKPELSKTLNIRLLVAAGFQVFKQFRYRDSEAEADISWFARHPLSGLEIAGKTREELVEKLAA